MKIFAICCLIGSFIFGICMYAFPVKDGRTILFNNDAPFGSMMSQKSQLDNYYTAWNDLEWIGFSGPGAPIYSGNILICNFLGLFGAPFALFWGFVLLFGFGYVVIRWPKYYRYGLMAFDFIFAIFVFLFIVLGVCKVLDYDTITTTGVAIMGLFPIIFLFNVFSMEVLDDQS